MIKRDEAKDRNSCWNKARTDERVFVLLARDAAAPETVRFWASRRMELGKNQREDPQIVEALDCADRMEDEARRINYRPHGGGMGGHDEPQLAVYRYSEDFGRMGDLSGVFVASKSDVMVAMGKTAYLGEVLGKHSEVHAEISADTITLVTEDPDFVELFQSLRLSTGTNPIARLADEE
jgi:hypothetical protein